jgi:transcription termination/antitermination protein NusG
MQLNYKWYIVQTYVGFEDVVKRILIQKINNLDLSKQIKEVYVPTRNITKVGTKKEIITKEEKVHPGYVYVNMDYNKETAFVIQNTQYVSKIAGTGDTVLPLDDGYVEQLKIDLTILPGDDKTTIVTDYNIGDLVKVIDGPFKEMSGKVSAVGGNSMRINVLLTIFERDTEVELDINQVEKVIS